MFPFCRVQEVDNGFFEKFGSILKQASQKAALEECTPLAPLKEVEEQDGEQRVEADLEAENSSIRDSDSGNGTILDTDSEPDEHEKIDRYIEATGWNVSTYFYFIDFFYYTALWNPIQPYGRFASYQAIVLC